MKSIQGTFEALSDLCERSLKENVIPSFSFALFYKGQHFAHFGGYKNANVDEMLTATTPMPIGSIAKNLCGTLLMQLIQDKKLSLNDPIQNYLPELKLNKIPLSKNITIKHLLSHTSGIDGDLIIETTNDEDCLAQYVNMCTHLEAFSAPGETFAYCNAAFPILARITEKVSGRKWSKLIKSNIFEACDMFDSGILHELSESFVAWSHSFDKGQWRAHSPENHFHCMSAAGTCIYASPSDLVQYGRQHLYSDTREALLSRDSLKFMHTPIVEGPCFTFAHHWGGATMVFDWLDNIPVVGHDGAIESCQSFLRIFPDQDVVIALMCGGGDIVKLQREFFALFLSKEYGAMLPRPEQLKVQTGINLHLYEGHFYGTFCELDIVKKGKQLCITAFVKDGEELHSPTRYMAKPINKELFATNAVNSNQLMLQRFVSFDRNSKAFMFNFRGRNFIRVE